MDFIEISDIENIFKALEIPILYEYTSEVYELLEPNIEKYWRVVSFCDDPGVTPRQNEIEFEIEDIFKIYQLTPTGKISKTALTFNGSHILTWEINSNNVLLNNEGDITHISKTFLQSKSSKLLDRIVLLYNSYMTGYYLPESKNKSFWFITINLRENFNFKHTKRFYNWDVISEHEFIIDIEQILKNISKNTKK